MVARSTQGNEANHCHVIGGWPLLERLSLQGSSVSLKLVSPSLRDLSIYGMDDLETCKVVSPALSKLYVALCPRLDVSSMILPSLEYVDVHNCNVSAMILTCVEVVSFSDDVITCFNERGSYKPACQERRATLPLAYTFIFLVTWVPQSMMDKDGVSHAWMFIRERGDEHDDTFFRLCDHGKNN